MKHDLAALTIPRDDHSARASSAIRVVAVIAILTAIAGAGWIVSRERTASAPPPAPPVVRQPAKDDALLTATGYLVADREAKITPKISGRVAKLNVEPGTHVRRGDVLAVLESTSIRAQRDDANAVLAQAQREFDRQSALLAEGVTSRAQFDAAEAQLRSARARVEEVNVDLRDMTIRAPFDGTIATKNTEVGEVISSTTLGQIGGTLPAGAICTLVDLDTLQLVADVNESSIARLRVRQPAEIAVDAFPGRKWRGELTQILPTADRAKGTVQVKVAIRDRHEGLLPEMSATVAFDRSAAVSAAGGAPSPAPTGGETPPSQPARTPALRSLHPPDRSLQTP